MLCDRILSCAYSDIIDRIDDFSSPIVGTQLEVHSVKYKLKLRSRPRTDPMDPTGLFKPLT